MDPNRHRVFGRVGWESMGDRNFLLRSSVFVRNDAGAFLRKLDERIKFYDNEIEKLCNFQYQSFVKAFHELLQVRRDTTSMKVREMLRSIIAAKSRFSE